MSDTAKPDKKPRRADRRETNDNQGRTVVNTITGKVTGKVVQYGNISGGLDNAGRPMIRWSGTIGFVNRPTSETVRRVLALEGLDVPRARPLLPLIGPAPDRKIIGMMTGVTRHGDAIIASGCIWDRPEGLTDHARITLAISSTEEPEWDDGDPDSPIVTYRTWQARSVALDLTDECSWPGSTLELHGE